MLYGDGDQLGGFNIEEAMNISLKVVQACKPANGLPIVNGKAFLAILMTTNDFLYRIRWHCMENICPIGAALRF
jgi:hypothetical protein